MLSVIVPTEPEKAIPIVLKLVEEVEVLAVVFSILFAPVPPIVFPVMIAVPEVT